MKECKICGCGTNEETGICITCQSKQWKERLNPAEEKKEDKKNETKNYK